MIVNNVVFYGRICQDIELKYSKNNTAICRFSIAVNRQYQNQDKKVDYFNLVSFGKTAENIEKYFGKGSRIVVRCHAQQNEYTNKDGQHVSSVEFIVDSFSFVDTRAEGGITQNQNTQPAPEPTHGDYDGFMDVDLSSDELPFS